MAETNLTHDQEMHVESHAPYMKVFLGLAGLHGDRILLRPAASRTRSSSLVLGLMILAVIKASLVGWYFMHLKFEGRWVYCMLVPAGILAMVLIFALIPDIAMQPVTEENPDDEDESTAVPLARARRPGAGRSRPYSAGPRPIPRFDLRSPPSAPPATRWLARP